MSTEQEQARALAERIAARLAHEPAHTAPAADAAVVGSELAALRASLGEMQQRLAHIESHVTHADECAHETHAAPSRSANIAAPAGHSPMQSAPVPPHWTSSTYIPVVQHPSQERF